MIGLRRQHESWNLEVLCWIQELIFAFFSFGQEAKAVYETLTTNSKTADALAYIQVNSFILTNILWVGGRSLIDITIWFSEHNFSPSFSAEISNSSDF